MEPLSAMMVVPLDPQRSWANTSEELRQLIEAIWAFYPRPSHASVHAGGRWYRLEADPEGMKVIEILAPEAKP